MSEHYYAYRKIGSSGRAEYWTREPLTLEQQEREKLELVRQTDAQQVDQVEKELKRILAVFFGTPE